MVQTRRIMDVSLPQPPDDPLAPYGLSALCDGRRTDFPLGMLVETVKVMLNDVYLQEGLDFLLAHKHGLSKVEPLSSPGCWIARKKVWSSGVKIGPHTSAPVGAW